MHFPCKTEWDAPEEAIDCARSSLRDLGLHRSAPPMKESVTNGEPREDAERKNYEFHDEPLQVC